MRLNLKLFSTVMYFILRFTAWEFYVRNVCKVFCCPLLVELLYHKQSACFVHSFYLYISNSVFIALFPEETEDEDCFTKIKC